MQTWSVTSFYAGPMSFHVDTDVVYLVATKARSRITGYYYLSDHFNSNSPTTPKPYDPVHIKCHLLRPVFSSEVKAETASLFFDWKIIINIWQMLHALGHPQPPTPAWTDNSTASSFATKCSKSWNMHYHWLKDKVRLKKNSLFIRTKAPNNVPTTIQNIFLHHTINKSNQNIFWKVIIFIKDSKMSLH